MDQKCWLRHLFKPWCLFPIGFFSQGLNLFIDYTICAETVSIILGGETIKEVLHDSLAITFISEVSDVMWTVAATLYHLEPFDDFRFRRRTQTTQGKSTESG